MLTFHIPAALREFAGGRSTVQIDFTGRTLLDALTTLWTAYPGLRDRVVNEQGQIRQHINLFVGNEDVRYTGGLTTPVDGKAAISIVPAVSGG